MQSLIETVVKKLVDKPDEVNVEAVESDQTIIYELTVGDGDYGKVIGKKVEMSLLYAQFFLQLMQKRAENVLD